MTTTIEKLADFTCNIRFKDLPVDVISESKRILLDSTGCALAGLNSDKGKIAVEFAHLRKEPEEATILGVGNKASVFAASFANGELIQALDYDAIHTPPGHVSPFVIPACLALAEREKASGEDLILAIAIAHEVSVRFGMAMGYYRDPDAPKDKMSPTSGLSSTVFGATLAAGLMLSLKPQKLARALGIAGRIAPAQSMTKWGKTVPASMDKYLMAGWVSEVALNSVFLAELGYAGDISVLEGDYGFWRYMGSGKWSPELMTDKLGETWRFPPVTIYKPYPCCRIMQTAIDCFIKIIEDNQLQPEEIEEVNVYVDPHVVNEPIWQNREIVTDIDAQMSIAYPFAVAAHRVPIGPEWLDLSTLRNTRILGFMDKIKSWPHPQYAQELGKDPASRIGKAEITARGKQYTEERKYRKGSPAIADTRMSDEELVSKFKYNALRILPSSKIDTAAAEIMSLERVTDVSKLTSDLVI
ncbi:MmgE/PrpD family protein [Chloroflexota bacterium]